MVLGFTLKVLKVTSRLTDVKKGAEKKLKNVGITSVVAGLLIGVAVLGMPANERNSMIVASFNIAAVGISTLIQYYLKPQNEKVLGWGAVGVVILGLVLCGTYVLVH